MKLTKQNVCVFIEDEAQLQQARELLERYGERTDRYLDNLIPSDPDEAYFVYAKEDNDWWLCSIPRNISHLEKITLTELEEILKEEKDNAKFTYNSDGSVSISLNSESEKQRDQVNEFFDPDYRENRRKWNEAIENSKTGLFVVDKNGNITELK